MKQEKEKPKSLLQTACNKQLGASKKALTVIQSNVRAPVKKIQTVPRSDESRVSALTASVAEMAEPALVREVGDIGEIEVPVHMRAMKANFDGPNFRSSKIKFGLGAARRITPQPKTVAHRLMKVPTGNRGVEVQRGIIISAPSPMSLDRIQVQLGQEKVLPESKEVLAEKEAQRRQKEQEARELQYQQAIEKVRKQLQADARKEHGEGFEAQLDDYDPIQVIDAEREVLAAMMQQVQPSKDSPSHMAEARFLARKALASARKGKFYSSDDPMANFHTAKGVPVSEIMMNQGKRYTSDESISTIGNPPVKCHALVDSMESTDGTAALLESARNEACAINTSRGRKHGADLNCGTMFDGVGAVLGAAVAGDNVEVNNVPHGPSMDLDDDVVDLTKRDAARKHARSLSPRPEDQRNYREEIKRSSSGGNLSSPRSFGGISGKLSGTGSGSKHNENINCVDISQGAVMCGAVPLYFLYQSQNEENNNNRGSKMTAVVKSKNLEELQQRVEEAADIAMADSKKTPHAESGKNKQILDKDDAYWDTLSTIASTRGLDEKFVPAKANPGPIPIEITAVNDKAEEKETTSSKPKKKKKSKAKNKPKTPETMVMKYSEVSEKSSTPKASGTKSARSKLDADGKTGPEVIAPTSNENMNLINSMPEGSTPKHKNNHISWGDEQMYKQNSASRRGSAAYGNEPHIEEDMPPMDYKEEQELLTRTLQLSKDLLASLTNDVGEVGGRNMPIETEPSFQDAYTLSSNEDFPIDVEKLIAEHGYGNDIDQEEVIPAPKTYHKKEYHHRSFEESVDDSFRSPRTPQILSKLDVLRAQRAQALARFNQSKKNTTGEPSVSTAESYERVPLTSTAPEVRRREPPKFFDSSLDSPLVGQHHIMHLEDRDEFGSEASATPSKKAQDLRRQLDEALLASREIRRSQEKLGNELQTFKSRFNQRNGEIEDQALRAMRTTSGYRHADI